MGCGFIPVHWTEIQTALKEGKRVEFWPGHYAVWNNNLQCGWLHSYLTPIKRWDKTFYGWDIFIGEVLESICNNDYRIIT